MDFTQSVSKFEKEAEKRKKLAKEKQKKQEIARKRQEKLEQERAAQRLIRKQEQEREQEAQEQKEREEYRVTGGIKYEVELNVVYTDGEDDKVILPQSSLETLMSQNAFDLGPMCFKIYTTSGNLSKGTTSVTHCGVREFTADEGSVGVPRKVLESMGVSESVFNGLKSAGDHCRVTLKFVLLSKITNVRIQPLFNLFSHVGPVKNVLEENLKHHSTLSVGDRLTVYYRGKEHSLIVKDISLESDKQSEDNETEEVERDNDGTDNTSVRGGTLINTDVVVDIDMSEEYLNKEKIENLPPQVHTSEVISASLTSSGRKLGGKSSIVDLHDTVLPCDSVRNDVKRAFEELEDEPQAGSANVINCKIKTPQGKTFTRRFDKDKPLSQLFSYVYGVLESHQLPVPQASEIIQLSTRQPSRTFTELDVVNSIHDNKLTFTSIGIESNSELFFVSFI